MVNRIKDIVNKLDGYSRDNQRFAVTAFSVNGAGIELSVKPYLKDEEYTETKTRKVLQAIA